MKDTISKTQEQFNYRHAVEQLAEIGKKLSMESDGPDQVLQGLVDAAANKEFLAADAVTLYQYNNDTKEFVCPPKIVGINKPAIMNVSVKRKGNILFDVLKAPNNIFAEDVLESKILSKSQFTKRENIASCAAVRLFFGEKPVGVIFLNYRKKHKFTKDYKKVVDILAAYATAICHAASYSRLRDLTAMLPELASNIDRKTLIESIGKKVKNLVSADHIHIRVIDWHKNELVLEKHVNEEDEKDIGPTYPQFSALRIEQAIGGRVFRNRKSEIIPDVQQDDDFIIYRKEIENKNPNLQDLQGLIKYLHLIGPAIVVPLLLHNKAIGVLAAIRLRSTQNTQLPLCFTEYDRIILEYFANQAAIALRNAWLFEAATWYPRREESLPVETLCEGVIEEVMRRTGANDGKVRFVDWKKKRLVPGFILPEERNLVFCTLRDIGVCPAGVAVNERRIYLAGNLYNDKNFKKFFNYAKRCQKSYQNQLDTLCALNKSIISNGSGPLDLNNIVQNLRKKWQKGVNKELEKRINVLKALDNAKKITDLLTMQIKFLERLTEGWRKYINSFLENWQSEVDIPIFFGDKLLGALNVHSKEKNWFTNSDVAILQALAGRIAFAVMEHQLEVLSKIKEIEHKMTTTWQYEEIADLIAQAIERAAFFVGPEEIYPLLYICETPTPPDKLLEGNFGEKFKFEPRATASEEEKKLGVIRIRNKGVGWEAIYELSKKPEPDKPVFIVRENLDDPISGGSKSAQEHGVMTTACLPLAFGGNVYGLLYIHIKRSHFFTELEKETLILFAAQAAIALRNAPALKGGQVYNEVFGDILIKKAIKRCNKAIDMGKN